VTLKIWDFETQAQESVLTGHGWDVKDVSWHPHNSLIVSGSKDNLIKLWDSKSAQNIATMYVAAVLDSTNSAATGTRTPS
jgi:polyadenylation factor subunit 2